VGKQKQGSIDPASAWAIARTNWVMQLLVCFGKATFAHDNTTAPAYFKNLPALSINQIAF